MEMTVNNSMFAPADQIEARLGCGTAAGGQVHARAPRHAFIGKLVPQDANRRTSVRAVGADAKESDVTWRA
jgi:hypothetical protein